MAIPPIVLHQEHGVEHNGDVPQCEFGRVPSHPFPVPTRQQTVQANLSDAQHAAQDIGQDLLDRPAGRALEGIIRVDLGAVFDDGDDDLEKGDAIDEIEPRPRTGIPRGNGTVVG